MMMRSTSSARSFSAVRRISTILRRSGGAFVAVAALASSGCYRSTAQPLSASLVEQRAEFVVSDVGRVALRDQLGAGVRTVEGRVVLRSDSSWTLRVYRLTTIGGESFAWMGESVVVPVGAVAVVSSRDFDRKGTMLLAAGISGAVAAFIWSRGLFGGGFTSDEGPGGPVETELRR